MACPGHQSLHLGPLTLKSEKIPALGSSGGGGGGGEEGGGPGQILHHATDFCIQS